MLFPQSDRETSLDELFHPKRNKPNEGVSMESNRVYGQSYDEKYEEPYVGRGVAKASSVSDLPKKGTPAEDREFDPGSNLMDALSVLHTSQADVSIALNTLETLLKPVLANVYFNEEPVSLLSPSRVALSLDRSSPALSSVIGAIDANDNLITKIKGLVRHLTLG